MAAASLLTLLGASRAALAITDQERWAAHLQLTQAQEAKKKGQLPEALAHYEESLKLDPKLQTMTELAELEEQLGKLDQARLHWTLARDKAAQAGATATKQRAEERLAALEKSSAHLTLQLAADAPSDSQILLDGAPLDSSSLGTALILSPGDHAVTVKAPGRDDETYPVKLVAGESQTLQVGPKAKVAPPPPPPPSPSPVIAPKPAADEGVSLSSVGSGQRTLGIVVGSVGLVGAGVGTVFWSVGWRDRATLGPTSDRNLLIGQIGVAGGALLLATGVVLYLTAPSGHSRTASSHFTPTLDVGRERALVGAVGRF